MNDQLPAWTTLTVTTRTPAADGVVSLTLRRPDGGVLPAWTPGAHIDVLLEGDDGEEGGLIRQYSLCGRPADRAGWQIAVLREPRGRGGSAYVHDHLREGTTVRVRGPRNTFPLRPAARHLFIAGGVGITPILPMVEAAEAAGDDWLLLYGGRTRASMAFLDRLAPHGDRVLIRPQDEYGLLDLAAHLGVPEEGTLVHACGPEPLLLAVQEQCAGWPPGTLGVERFAPTQPNGSGPAEAFELELARSGLTLTVPSDRSVLETVEEAGVAVDFSCREGTCGTCETDVLDGKPDHRDSLLSEDERAAGDTMLICVSRSCGPRLVLDL
ncbi:PDR/VanB family oxidoreductase [Streptomyces sp. NBC_00201]|uniref:PDR/VanB family oxidoreductase n=1 Tax=unclassified Streptomyces TaxID=2593676 RepID=UPI0022552605|nr:MULTISPECIES: PDR/VanB family oxidoreductase [unclassified Streptomyces]MCX5059518.1 PDR/VanB family oxidoreductase [Streptomyces sp. NBC_00452]MCX5243836.1 PDR/VanB family oxidoreductase [Streptomyces sp. NBC_00201]MCX5290430.1 PDR/VanB family oxidoreductase [Streptomyces sp. NBC_00183]